MNEVSVYNKMSEEELQTAYNKLKEWLHDEYSEQINAALIFQDYNARFPVDLQDKYYYELDINYNLICYGAYAPLPEYIPVAEELTIIADKLEYKTSCHFGVIKKLNAPFCMEISKGSRLCEMFSCEELKEIRMPELKIAQEGNFSSLSLNKLELPKLEEAGYYSFNAIQLSTTAEFPELVTVGELAFGGARISKIVLPKCKSILNYAFVRATQLRKIELWTNKVCLGKESSKNHPEAIHIVYKALDYACVGLPKSEKKDLQSFIILDDKLPFTLNEWNLIKELTFENLTILDKSSIIACSNLEIVALPRCEYIHPDAIVECYALKKVIVPKALTGSEFTTKMSTHCQIEYI